jgi:ligand-binding sensor domain-containing protein
LNPLKTSLFFSILLFLSSLPGSAQPFSPEQPDPVFEQWRWQSFPQLRGPGFRDVAEDREGNVWFATDSGLKRYDGLHWTDFSVDDGLHGAPINVICAARNGKVYAGSRRGISVFEHGKCRLDHLDHLEHPGSRGRDHLVGYRPGSALYLAGQ